ncbi:MAG TPA: hypothetical protein VHU82_00550 [Vicinamibacterales bacterium]|jgi:hypothetical protein|nr:hypothetical protein [Vicinamibacterales bacterium]
MIDTSRRELLANVAKALPLAAAVAAESALLAQTAQAPTPQTPAALQPVQSARTGVNAITAVLNSFSPGAGGFAGTLTVTRFDVVNGVLSAVADLSGDVLSPTGGIVGPAAQSLTLPAQVSGSCTILTLTLGPLDLKLLETSVHLNQVVMNITAVSDANSPLCAVANLLNSGGALSTLLNNLVSALNNILSAV